MPDAPDADIVGFNALLGFRVAEWRPDWIRMEFDIAEHHRNRSGQVHGGVLATFLDATMSFSGCYPPSPGARRRRCVTLTLTTTFIGGAKSGTLACVAERRGGGNSVFMTSGEIRDDEGALVAIAEGTYRYISETLR